MSNFEVPSPILSSPFEEPKEHWWILEGQPAERRPGRRPALYFYRDPKRETDERGGLGFAIPYLHNGQMHDYQPDFIIRLETPEERYLLLETKGYDPLEDVKQAAAERWSAAVNAEGSYGRWSYAIVRRPEQVKDWLDASRPT